MTEVYHSKIRAWQETAKRLPVLEDFALPEDIEHEKKNPVVVGFSTTVEISYIDDPNGLFHKAELYIPFEGKIKWFMEGENGKRKEVGTPKYWRQAR